MNKNEKYSTKKTRKHRSHKKIVLAICVLLVALAIGGYFVHRDRKSDISTEAPATSSASIATKGGSSTTSTLPSSNSSADSSKSTSNSSGGSSGSTTPPAMPYGNFVSNHYPNLSGYPAPNTEQSACNTTPGATCDISFKNNGITKDLGAKVSDSNGVVIWNWTLSQVGLTQGSWTVTASATLNNQTVTAADSALLEVKQ